MKLSSRRRQRDSRAELSMTSMIDVVFLLLIFFMTTSNFVRTERNLDPSVKVDKSSSSAPSELEPVIVEVRPAGSGAVYQLGGRSMQTAGELREVLGAMPSFEDGAFVKVSNRARFGDAAAAIQACKDAGFFLVSYVPMDE
jgi:biopolymer transport protein ExbD